jgi:hypothetical protein
MMIVSYQTRADGTSVGFIRSPQIGRAAIEPRDGRQEFHSTPSRRRKREDAIFLVEHSKYTI